MSVKLQNIRFSGNGQVGPKVFAVCPSCGFCFQQTLHFGMPIGMEVELEGVTVECPRCFKSVPIENGRYEFNAKALKLLIEAKLTKKQVKRFSRQVEKAANLNSIPLNAATINPLLEVAATMALREPNPKSALKQIVEIATLVTMIGGGVVTADILWDRLHNGELFELHSLNEIPEVKPDSDQNTDEKAPDRATRKSFEEWKPIDV